MEAVLRELKMRELENSGYDVMDMLARGELPDCCGYNNSSTSSGSSGTPRKDLKAQAHGDDGMDAYWGSSENGSPPRQQELRPPGSPRMGLSPRFPRPTSAGYRSLNSSIDSMSAGGGSTAPIAGSVEPRRWGLWGSRSSGSSGSSSFGRRQQLRAAAGPVAEARGGDAEESGPSGSNTMSFMSKRMSGLVAQATSAASDMAASASAMLQGTPDPEDTLSHQELLTRSRSKLSFTNGASLRESSMAMMGNLLSKDIPIDDDFFRKEATNLPAYHGSPHYLLKPGNQHPNRHLFNLDEISEAQAATEADKVTANVQPGHYRAKDTTDKLLEGADLRERNITWWNKSLSPEEYPLKLGQWKKLHTKAEHAKVASRKRRPAKPKAKIVPRKRSVLWGLPDLPTRPELSRASALLFAVRTARVEVVRTLLECSLGTINTPDGWGYPPLSYAMYMMVRERSMNSDKRRLMCIVDTLLVHLPDPNLGLHPGAPADPRARMALVRDLVKQEPSCLVDSTDPDTSCCKSADFLPDVEKTLTKFYADDPSRHKPYHRHSVMNPLVLAMLLSEDECIPRLSFLVTRCNASLLTAYVYMPDVAIYCMGDERYFSTCHTIIQPVHVAVANRKFNSVKWCLDLGASPNMTGIPMIPTNNPLIFEEKFNKDKASIEQDRDEDREYKQKCAERKKAADAALAEEEAAADANEDVSAEAEEEAKKKKKGPSLFEQIKNIKRVIAGIEIPMLTKPQPWVSPLHLAGRHGLAEISSLLLDRGAMVNGGEAARHAKKTPFEEAASFARREFRGSNDMAARPNHQLMKSVVEDCIPEMNANLKAAAINEAASKAAKMFDPTTAALKAASLAAKIIIMVMLEMRKRPIVHWDPALFAAHTMLLSRAPLNAAEGQTSIIIRDIMDNSTWAWAGEKVKLKIDDDAWQLEATKDMRRLRMSRMGRKAMLKTTDLKEYRRFKKAVICKSDTAYFTAGAKAMLDVYNAMAKEVIEEQKERAKANNARLLRLTQASAQKYKTEFQQLLDQHARNLQGAMGEKARDLAEAFAFEAASFQVSAVAELLERSNAAMAGATRNLDADLRNSTATVDDDPAGDLLTQALGDEEERGSLIPLEGEPSLVGQARQRAASAVQAGVATITPLTAQGGLEAQTRSILAGKLDAAQTAAQGMVDSAGRAASESLQLRPSTSKKAAKAPKTFKLPSKKPMTEVQATITIATVGAAAAAAAAAIGASTCERLTEEANQVAKNQLTQLAVGMRDNYGAMDASHLGAMADQGLDGVVGPLMVSIQDLVVADGQAIEESANVLADMDMDALEGAMAYFMEMQVGLADMLELIGIEDAF